jgi:hypothetical protein
LGKGTLVRVRAGVVTTALEGVGTQRLGGIMWVATHGLGMVNQSSAESIAAEDLDVQLYTIQAQHKWTFESGMVRKWVENRLEGRVLNPCCGPTKLKHSGEVVRNDLDESVNADYHMKARDLPDELGSEVFDTIVFDPPWNVYQANEKYDGRMVGKSTIMGEALDELLKHGGKVLSFGYIPQVMPREYGYERDELAVFAPHGRRKAFFGVVESHGESSLSEFL